MFSEPAWLSAINHDIDGDGTADFTLCIKDNDDEAPPAPNAPTNDSDQRVFIVSRCTKFADSPKEVEELVEFTGGGTNYRDQQGLDVYGAGNNNGHTP